jgi:hypothetical protein
MEFPARRTFLPLHRHQQHRRSASLLLLPSSSSFFFFYSATLASSIVHMNSGEIIHCLLGRVAGQVKKIKKIFSKICDFLACFSIHFD